MFGFFKNKWSEQKVKVLSKEISEIFTALFPGGGIPKDFMNELYVQGFLIGYASAVMDLRFEAQTWPKDRKASFHLALYRNISGMETYELDRILLDLEYAKVLSADSSCLKGKDDGGVCAVLIHNKLKAGYTEPLIEEARAYSRQMNVDLGAAILSVTLMAFKLEWESKQ